MNQFGADEDLVNKKQLELIEELERKHKESKERYENLRIKLREAIWNQAKYALGRGETPMILNMEKISGQTPYLAYQRFKAHNMHLKALNHQLREKLFFLKRTVFCLDNDENPDHYCINCSTCYGDINYNYLNYDEIIHDEPINVLDWFKCISLPKLDNGDINIGIMNFKIPENEISFDEMDLKVHNLYEKLKNNMNDIEKEIDEVSKALNENMKINNIPVKVKNSFDIYKKINDDIHNINDILSKIAEHSKYLNIPSYIWNTEKKIQNKMIDLLNSINKISLNLSKWENDHSLLDFSYKKLDPITIKVPNENEYKEFIKLSKELQDEINISEQLNKDYFETNSISQNLTKENDIDNCFQLIESNESQERNKEISELKEKMIKSNEESINAVKKLINTLPQNIKDIKFEGKKKNDICINLTPKIKIKDINFDEFQKNEDNNFEFKELTINPTEIPIPQEKETVIYSENKRFKELMNHWTDILQKSTPNNNSYLLIKRKHELTENINNHELRLKNLQNSGTNQNSIIELEKQYEKNKKEYNKYKKLNQMVPIFVLNKKKEIENLQNEIINLKQQIQTKKILEKRCKDMLKEIDKINKQTQELDEKIKEKDNDMKKKCK